jgi:hypothetical protein
VRNDCRPFSTGQPIRRVAAMRAFIVLTLMAIAVAAWSCGGSSKPSRSPATAVSSAAAASPATTVAARSPVAATPVASAQTSDSPAAGAVDEVTGIVGTVNSATSTILIDRLSGAPVRKIAVDTSTVIRRVSGDTITLSQVRVSERIVASGHLNDRQDALVANNIVVQDVLPGAQPGG